METVFVINALLTAFNTVMFVKTRSYWSLGAAIFCGLVTISNIV